MGKKSRNSRLKKANKNEDKKSSSVEVQDSHKMPECSAEELLDRAEGFLDTFNYDAARQLCQQALQVDPLSCRALELSGLLFLQADDVDLARICYRKAADLSPDEGHVKYMYLGQLSSGMEAIQFYLKGIEVMSKKITEALDKQDAKEAQATDGATNTVKRTEVTCRDVSSAFCAIAEIFLTDACFEEDADVRCKESVDKALETDPSNAEAYHLLASYWLSKDDTQAAGEAIEKGISLWLPQLRAAVDQPEGGDLPDPVQVCPVPYASRINCSKMLIELEKYEVASDILELLLDEDDQVVEVWYLLGWMNYLRGDDYKTNARHYLQKGQELALKIKYEDEQMIDHMAELMTELGPEEEEADEENGMQDDDEEIESESEEDEEKRNEDRNEVEQMDHQ